MDLNTAGQHDLATLPGIGITVAKRIVQYRQDHGQITSFDELLDIPGFGGKKLAVIEEYCNISQTSLTGIYDRNAQLSNNFYRDITWSYELSNESDEEDQEYQYRRCVSEKLEHCRRLSDYTNPSLRPTYISPVSLQQSAPSCRGGHIWNDYSRNYVGENSSKSYNLTEAGVSKQQSYPSHLEENSFYDQAPKSFSNDSFCKSHNTAVSQISKQLTYPSYFQESTLYQPSPRKYVDESLRVYAKQESPSYYRTSGRYLSESPSALTKQESTLYYHTPEKKCSNEGQSTSIKQESTAYYHTPSKYSSESPSVLMKQDSASSYPSPEKYSNKSSSTSAKQESASYYDIPSKYSSKSPSASIKQESILYYHTPEKYFNESPSTSIKQESAPYYHTPSKYSNRSPGALMKQSASSYPSPEKYSNESPSSSIKQESFVHYHTPGRRYSNESSGLSRKQENTVCHNTPGSIYSNNNPNQYNIPASVKLNPSLGKSVLVSNELDSPNYCNKKFQSCEKMLPKMPCKCSDKKETRRFDLNTASVEELKRVGITDVTSQKIVKYRKNHKFESFDDLHLIPYMHKKTIEKLKQCCVIKKPDADLSSLASSLFDELNQKTPRPKKQPLTSTCNDLTHKLHQITATKDFSDTSSTSIFVANELDNSSHSMKKPQTSTKISSEIKSVNADKNPRNRLDLNSVSVEELKQIGITDVTAQKIISYRKKYKFESFDDLYCINNMRKQTVDKLKQYCTIEQKKDTKSLPVVYNPLNQLIPYKDICSYKSVEEFQSLEVGNALLMLHVNIRSLNKNLPKLEKLIKPLDHPCDIICVSDTYNPKFEEDVQLSSYTYHESQSVKIPRTRQGGVAIYLEENLKCYTRKDLMFFINKCETLWLEITLRRKSLVVGVIYFHDFKKPFQAFQKELEKIAKKLAKEKKAVYILGDININLLNQDGNTANYCEFLHKLGFQILITEPTRETKTRQKGTLLDHIYTTDDQVQNVRSGIIKEEEQVVSDHYPIYCVV